MKIKVSELELSNIGQTIEFAPASESASAAQSVMGTLSAVLEYEEHYGVVVGGKTYRLEPDHDVSVVRSMELNSLHALWKMLDEALWDDEGEEA